MIISAIQFDIKWCEPSANEQFIEKYIETNLAASDVVILPEMFTTGFSMNAPKIAEPMESSHALRWMKDCAVRFRKAMVGSVAIVENGNYYNRLFFVREDGAYDYSDKRHLFRMSKENESYTQGTERKIIEYKGVRFLPLVCYDLRFPVWSSCSEQEYDVLLYVASWPDARIHAWDTLLKARAMENLSYVVGVNRVGDDKYNHYNGHSVVLDYCGEPLATAAENCEEAVTATISMEKLRDYRTNFPVHLDNDRFKILL